MTEDPFKPSDFQSKTQGWTVGLTPAVAAARANEKSRQLAERFDAQQQLIAMMEQQNRELLRLSKTYCERLDRYEKVLHGIKCHKFCLPGRLRKLAAVALAASDGPT